MVVTKAGVLSVTPASSSLVERAPYKCVNEGSIPSWPTKG